MTDSEDFKIILINKLSRLSIYKEVYVRQNSR